ncbi:MAG TPA: exodeoxyribonuclease VII large subunit, partial [Pelomicrobium sp.]|nr:exodeoxyribonuclease VII large subunit [Pelomicrobium sp.]
MSLANLLADPAAVVTVSQLNRSTRALLEQTFPLLWVRGEISNLRRYDSGHWYFVLKDAEAQVRCVMFRHRNAYLDWQPKDGALVEVRALVTLYEARGDYQLNVETMRRAGQGALYEAFERLKARLEREGLFDAARKRPLPAFARRVGIVTSPAAAALRDVLTTLKRRMPSLPVVLYPTPVQGEGAAEKIAAALAAAGARAECDVLILCRGGGSIEDLWSFTEEVVARAVAASPLPVVVGVGHETDFTIADFVADRRAPTPTAAAEMVSPDRRELAARLAAERERLGRSWLRALEARMQRRDFLSRRLVHPGRRVELQRRRLDEIARRLRGAEARNLRVRGQRVQNAAARLTAARPAVGRLEERAGALGRRLARGIAARLTKARDDTSRLARHLEHLDPQRVLERGYAIARRVDGAVVRESRQLAVNEELHLAFAAGWAR